MSFRCCKNDRGVSATTWSTRIRVWITVSNRIAIQSMKGTFRYSTNRFKNATKCSAFRIFPGIASFKRSSGNTETIRLCYTKLRSTYMDYPLSYRYHYHLTSILADLRRAWHIHPVAWQHHLSWLCVSWTNTPMITLKKTCSSILSDSLTTLRPAASSIGLVRSMLNDSMQTLSTSTRCQ